MSRNDERDAAAGATESAAERGLHALEQVLEVVNPLLATALEKAEDLYDQAGPYAETAKEKLAPLAEQAKEHGSNAKDRIAPLAATAAAGSAGLAAKANEQIKPHLESVTSKVQPAVENARDKVSDDIVPQLLELLHQAEQHPAVSEASRRGQATVAALRGDLSLPEPKKERSAVATVAKLGAAAALMAAAAVAVRQFLASKDDAWTAHQPSEAYTRTEKPATSNVPESGPSRAASVPANPDTDSEPEPEEQMAAEGGRAPEETVAPTSDGLAAGGGQGLGVAHEEAPAQGNTRAQDVDSEPDPHEKMSAEGGPVRGAETTNEDIAVLNSYGEGSYVGEEPPSDYTIKGNERSMKYHTAENAGYERTIADVWFNSPEAAEKAGFSRAQR